MDLLRGKKSLVPGKANARSIAAGYAHAFHAQGAELALSYLSEKSRPCVEPVAKAIRASGFRWGLLCHPKHRLY